MLRKILIGKSKKEVIDALNKMTYEKQVLSIIKMNLDFSLIKRNEDGDIIFNGDLIIDKKDLRKLPENLKVNGDLWCSYNDRLIELPKGLSVTGTLDCYNCSINKLPDNLFVGENFNCSNNLIIDLPKKLFVGEDFNCNNNLISNIPNDITVNGDLYCDDNGDVIVPKSATIKGDIIGGYILK